MGFKYQIYDQSKAYYLTLTVVRWIDIFTRQKYRDIIIESLKFCQQNKGLNIYSYVIMSNHMHLLVSANNDDLSNLTGDFKRWTSKQIHQVLNNDNEESRKEWMLNLFAFEARKHTRNEDFQFWTHDNHPEEIYSNKFILQKVIYIHNNPVRAGIVDKQEDYKYSSARNYADMEGLIDVIRVNLYDI